MGFRESRVIILPVPRVANAPSKRSVMTATKEGWIRTADSQSAAYGVSSLTSAEPRVYSRKRGAFGLTLEPTEMSATAPPHAASAAARATRIAPGLARESDSPAVGD